MAGAAAILVLLAVLIVMRRRRKRLMEMPNEENEETFLALETDLPIGSGMRVDEDSLKERVEPQGEALEITLAPVRGSGRLEMPCFQLKDSLVLGRRKGADVLILGDDLVSGRQCELILENGLVVMIDLGSKNGTLLNGMPLKGRSRLESGDLLGLGESEFRIVFGERR
jgi:hypothetical protein